MVGQAVHVFLSWLTVLEQALLLDQGSGVVRATLDVASLQAALLDLGGAVAQVLLAVLEESTANGLLLGGIVSGVARDDGRPEDSGDEGGEVHDECPEECLESVHLFSK